MIRSTPLDDAQYVSLRSYRKNGSARDTPVWVEPLDGKLMVFTLDDSYKVKRIARNPAVEVARGSDAERRRSLFELIRT